LGGVSSQTRRLPPACLPGLQSHQIARHLPCIVLREAFTDGQGLQSDQRPAPSLSVGAAVAMTYRILFLPYPLRGFHWWVGLAVRQYSKKIHGEK